MDEFVAGNKKLLAAWDSDKNKEIGLDPTMLSLRSSKKAWWKCPKGHSWQQRISKRAKSKCDCPVCAGKILQVGMTDLATTHPNISAQWHPTKNGSLKPTDVSAGSNRKIWWVCPRGHEWQTEVCHRTSGRGCPYCKSELHTSFPEQALLFYLSKVAKTESRYIIEGKEADIYLPSFNAAIEYNGYFFHGKKAKKKYDLEKERTFASKGIRLIKVLDVREPIEGYREGDDIFLHMDQKYAHIGFAIREICEMLGLEKIDVNVESDYQEILGQYYELAKEGSLAAKNPKLSAEWHPTKNGGLKPEQFSVSSSKCVWWLGKCGHEWQAKISNRNMGKGCPFCNQYLVNDENNLEALYPELAAEWHPIKNGDLKPNQILPGSNKIVWWIDSAGNEWLTKVCTRVRYGTGAPQLRGEKMVKTRMKKNLEKGGSVASKYPRLLDYWKYDANGAVDPSACTCGTHLKVWWKCPVCGDSVCREIRWEISLFKKGTPCLKCAKKEKEK